MSAPAPVVTVRFAFQDEATVRLTFAEDYPLEEQTAADDFYAVRSGESSGVFISA
jgi:hypothetical protein